VVNDVLLFGIFLCNQWLHILQTLRNRRLHIPGSVLSVAPDAIEREILIDAPPSVVWPIVTEAQHLGGWFSDEAEIDLRPGGRMLLTWHEHGTYEGRVEIVDAPRVFAFRWQTREGEFSETNSTLVVMTVEAEEAGTRLRVLESGFAALPWPDDARARYVDENSRGWLMELDELRDYLGRVVTANRDR
jgi:uncharacterized protein YndB with AHSA1/START domain